jgi:hypothetical protein
MKLDYNHLLETIDAIMSNSRSKVARENGFGIGIGLNMLTSYIKQIAERAIEINDEILLELLEDMMVIKRSDADHPTEKGGD